MSSFSISSDARAEIRRIIAVEMHTDPAVSFVDCGPVQPVPEIVKAAIRAPDDAIAGDRAEEFLRNNYKLSKVRSNLQLDVVVNDRKECRDEDLIELDGLLFAIPAYLLKLLSPYTLGFEGGKFHLENEQEIVRCLSDIKGMNIW